MPHLPGNRRFVGLLYVSSGEPLYPQCPHGGREKHLLAYVFLAGLSAVVFWLCPLRTGIQVLVFVASIAVVLICHVALTSMDGTYANKDAGYWPKPLDWSAPSKSDKSPTAETKS